MPEERPFVRAGWFRGPRGAVVFSYSCPDCQAVSRWYRAVHPEITLNPRKWGRLCGETEDLKMWLARYLGVRLRVCCPLDWDHVWTEVWDGSRWAPLDPDCVNFARRLHEGIGAWTAVLAIAPPPDGAAGAGEATEEVSEAYLAELPGGSEAEVEAWRGLVEAARADATGGATQSRTLCGHVVYESAGFSASRVTEELRAAQADFDAGRELWDIAG